MPGNIRLYGTSGYVELAAPATGNNAVLTLPNDSIQPGLVLITTQSFSAASSISINNCFSSTYSNYLIVIDITSTAANPSGWSIRLRSSGTDATTNYGRQKLEAYGTVVEGNINTTLGYMQVGNPATSTVTSGGTMSVQMFRPFENVATRYLSHHGTGDGTSVGVWGGYHSTASSYDGMTFYPQASTMSGILRIYGYRNL